MYIMHQNLSQRVGNPENYNDSYIEEEGYQNAE